ncbi:hypothetical protein [Nocardioides sp. B-3]|uniref:hypothetical protein n=1 Tax=Nocardioides sp. B-3 TaxID=2895565 RepID=UPI0021535801|nr:hypothetical protein [Nocardioides sp. B-3]UUZ59798.1 hypothetical protein LP418_01505 [Nocardioides sp. B-3]
MQTSQPPAAFVADATDDMSAREVLDLARSQQRAEDTAAARKLHAAALWADLHPPESLHQSATYTLAGIEHEEAIAGIGCPKVAEFCIAELGTVLGISTTAAKRLIGHSLELRHRLPRLWAAVHAGRVPASACPAGRRVHHPLHPGADHRVGRPDRRADHAVRREGRTRTARPPRD